ncbi:poly(A)-binding protein binding protein [Tieghemiomyces parasiticus]|uniref:Poly(A)-binding protein binding protein n=1 Tax=Tieghemiomyces parasiticus TaxID=78921 RepID=A0A9W8DYR2_9FUNG|nr:poly(A)-binding protein binding protein [Tieghemiomyces parasiticus]
MSAISGRSLRGRRGGGPGKASNHWPQGNSGSTAANPNTRFPAGRGPAVVVPPNGLTARPAPSIPTTASEVPIDDPVAHDALIFLAVHLVGLQVQVAVKGGKQFTGLLHSIQTEDSCGVVLKYAKETTPAVLTSEDLQVASARPVRTLVVLGKDLVSLTAVGVDFAALDRAREYEKLGFKTDTGISGHAGQLQERELHRWDPTEHDTPASSFFSSPARGGDWCDMDDAPAPMGGLEDAPQGAGGAWDQFAANERLFGLRTNFNEEIYTTKLDRSHPEFKRREQEATRLAHEIMQGPVSNVHIAEERGQEMQEDDLDEEDRYGAVIRDDKPSKYIPPSLRRQWEQNARGRPGPGATPIDPIPVSSRPPPGLYRAHTTTAIPQASPPQPTLPTVPPPVTTTTLASPAVSAVKAETQSLAASPAPTHTVSSGAIPRAKPRLPPGVGLAIDTKSHAVKKFGLSDPEARQRASPLDILAPKIAQQLAAAKETMSARPTDDGYGPHIPTSAVERSAKPIEHEIVGTFRQFVSTEKERLQQTKQAFLKKAKDGRVAELIQFSKSFQLKSPMPTDLLPIMGKSKSEAPTETPPPASQEKAEPLTPDPAAASVPVATAAESNPPVIKTVSETKPPTPEAKPVESKAPTVKPTVEPKSVEPEPTPKPVSPVVVAAVIAPVPKAGEAQATSTADPVEPAKEDEDKPSTPTGSKSKLNVKAMAFKPNPGAAVFKPKPRTAASKTTESTTSSPRASPRNMPSDPAFLAFFGTQPVSKGPLDLRTTFPSLFRPVSPPSTSSPPPTAATPPPKSVGPTWPFGNRPFVQQFSVTTQPGFEGDLYHGAPYPYAAAYPSSYPGYGRYPPGPPLAPANGGASGSPYGQPGTLPAHHPHHPPHGPPHHPMGVISMGGPLPYHPGQPNGVATTSHPGGSGYPAAPPPYLAVSSPYGAPVVLPASAGAGNGPYAAASPGRSPIMHAQVPPPSAHYPHHPQHHYQSYPGGPPSSAGASPATSGPPHPHHPHGAAGGYVVPPLTQSQSHHSGSYPPPSHYPHHPSPLAASQTYHPHHQHVPHHSQPPPHHQPPLPPPHHPPPHHHHHPHHHPQGAAYPPPHPQGFPPSPYLGHSHSHTGSNMSNHSSGSFSAGYAMGGPPPSQGKPPPGGHHHHHQQQQQPPTAPGNYGGASGGGPFPGGFHPPTTSA